MTRRSANIVCGLAAALAVAALSGCVSASANGMISVAGDTRYDPVTVQAPQITTPTPDVTLGFSRLETGTANAFVRSTLAVPPATLLHGAGPIGGQQQGGASGFTPRPAGRLASVRVRAGDRVRAGQILAVFDDSLLKLGVDKARADQRKASADVDVLTQRLDELADKQAQLATARTQAITGLNLARSKKEKLIASLTGLQHGIPLPPGVLPSPAPTSAAGQLPVVRGLLAQIDAGLAKGRAGLAQLATARVQLADAKEQLQNGRKIARIVVAAEKIAVESARYTLDRAVIRSPVDGVVVSAASPGTVVMVGTPIVVLRKDAPTEVDTYLSPEQVARIGVGDAAEVRLDSLPGRALEGTVTRVWPDETFPPTSYPTNIVHLSRVVRVTVTVNERDLPVGVPADVVIQPKTGGRSQ